MYYTEIRWPDHWNMKVRPQVDLQYCLLMGISKLIKFFIFFIIGNKVIRSSRQFILKGGGGLEMNNVKQYKLVSSFRS